MDIFEGLKIEGQQSVKQFFVGRIGLLNAGVDSRFEIVKLSIVLRIQALITDKLPEALNQVQMR